eukprot:COSAG02_NODE_6910_length_3295_cov_1.413642_2_plen_111_part_00
MLVQVEQPLHPGLSQSSVQLNSETRRHQHNTLLGRWALGRMTRDLQTLHVDVDVAPSTVVSNDSMQRRRWQVHVQKVVDSLTNGIVEDVGSSDDDDGTLRPASPSFITTN